jgi:hypothetical protein
MTEPEEVLLTDLRRLVATVDPTPPQALPWSRPMAETRCPTCGYTITPPHPCLYCGLAAGMAEANAQAAADLAAMRPEDHVLDEGSVTNPATGEPYPLWVGTEPQDPDPRCVCGAEWIDGRCSRG